MKNTLNTTFYTHYKNKQKYIVLGVCQYQHNNIWYNAVMYQSVETGDKYVREESDFDLKFKVVENE